VSGPSQVWNSSLYDSRHAFVWQYGAELIDLLAPRPGERILDLGSGTGHLAARIAEAGAEVTGIDASEAMVEQARRNYPALRFERMDAAGFHFDAPFDAVFSNATLHWVLRAGDAAACIARALKPGGRLVAEFGGRGNVARVVAAIRAARETAGLGAGDDLNPWYNPSLAEYATLLEEHGLAVTYASLFERPTRLDPGEDALRVWLDMFAGSFFAGLAPGTLDAVREDVGRRLRPVCYRDGAWVIDYRRLKIVAIKE
jgi:trans-aconitate methyltransferase